MEFALTKLYWCFHFWLRAWRGSDRKLVVRAENLITVKLSDWIMLFCYGVSKNCCGLFQFMLGIFVRNLSLCLFYGLFFDYIKIFWTCGRKYFFQSHFLELGSWFSFQIDIQNFDFKVYQIFWETLIPKLAWLLAVIDRVLALLGFKELYGLLKIKVLNRFTLYLLANLWLLRTNLLISCVLCLLFLWI